MTTQELARLERAFRVAQAKADTAREARNAAVRAALAAGWTHAAVAEATGLTRGRINQMK